MKSNLYAILDLCSNQFSKLKIQVVFIFLMSFSALVNAQVNCSCPSNLVLNPSFENGTNNWSWSGGTLNIGGGAVACGSYSGDFLISNGSSNWCSQTIGTNIAVGSQINVSVYAGTHDNTVPHYVSLLFFDASWNYISTSSVHTLVNKILANAPVGPQLYTFAGTVPSNAYYTQVSFSGSSGYIKTDNWCVTSSCNNVTSGGTIGSDETGCLPSFDPALITNVTSPSGGNTNALEYVWLVSNDAGATNSIIAGANSSTYDPPAITTTTWYRRCSRRAGCSNYDGESNWIQKTVQNCCNNVTDAGSIGFDESVCAYSYDPSPIISITLPSGGSSNLIEYVWLMSTDAGTNYTAIGGANSSTYDPGVISQTTWFRRCSRRAGCTDFTGETSWIMKEVKAPATANAGADINLTCTTPSGQIGTAAQAGNTYMWSPATALSATNVAQPTSNATATTTYTLVVTNSSTGCTASDAVLVTVNKSIPVANAGSNVTLTCTMPSATIGATAVAGNSYSWSPTAGLSSSTVANPTANHSSNTIYTLTVTNTASGCSAVSTVSATVNTTPPSANAGADIALTCTTPSGQIGTAAQAGNTYMWSPATALSATNVAQPTSNATANTTYTLVVTNSATGCTASDAVLVTVNKSIPLANAGSNVTLTCTMPSATIGATAVAGNSYSWSPTAGLSSGTVANPTANPSSNTIYTLTVTNTASGCSAVSTVSVTVNTTPPSANAGADIALTCTTPSGQIGTAAQAGNTYMWSPATALSATNVAQPTSNATANTTYTLVVTNSATGCTASDAVLVTVNKSIPVANAGSNVTLTCTMPSATIGATAVAGNSYSWSPTAGLSSSTVANPTANPSSNTIYTLTVTNTASGCSAVSTVNVIIDKSAPIADAGSNVILTCANSSATIGTTSTIGNSYAWSPSIGLSSPTISDPIASPTSSTIYTLTVTSANGCTAVSTISVTTNNVPPYVFTEAIVNITCLTPTSGLGIPSIAGNSYLWMPNTGLSSNTVSNPIANPTTTTSYTLTVTGANACTAQSVVLVNVNTLAPAPPTTVSASRCGIGSLTLTASSVSGSTIYWKDAAGTSIVASGNTFITPSLSSTTNYKVYAKDDINGCWSGFASVTATINPLINSGISGPNVVCATENLSLLATPTNSEYTYLWSSTGGATIVGSNNNSSVNFVWPANVANTNQIVSLIVSNPNTNCTNTYTHVVNVTTEVFANAGVDKIICQGGGVQLGAAVSGPPGAVYNWAPNYAINSTTVANPTVNPLVSTTYTLTTSLNGCVKTDIVFVNVEVILGPGAEAGSPVSTCANQAVIIGGNPTTAAIGATYLWTPNTGLNNSTISNPTVNVAISGWYKVKVTANTGCYNEDSVYVTINPCAAISGNVFIDNNGSTNIDGTPTPTAGSQLYANLANNTLVINSAPIGPNGTFSFNNLAPNSLYQVSLSPNQGVAGSALPSNELPSGWSNVGEDCCDNLGNDGNPNGQVSVPVTSGNVSNVNFGVSEPLAIGNVVWNDINKNGLKETTEPGLVGATLKLYRDNNTDGNPDGVPVLEVLSGTNGKYTFNGLTPGNYLIGATPPAVTAGNAYLSSPINEILIMI
jgi:hypothetical protein